MDISSTMLEAYYSPEELGKSVQYNDLIDNIIIYIHPKTKPSKRIPVLDRYMVHFCPFVVALSLARTCFLTSRKLSGLTEIEVIPHSTRKAANSGWLLGAWPQSPILQPAL
jgi:hypothetical protein